MRSQPKMTAYSDKRGQYSMRLPPAGTVSRESAADDSASLLPVNVERGKLRYQTFCAVCHGARGDGDGAVGGNLEGGPPASFAHDSVAMTSARTVEIITNGVGRMPAFAAQISARDRWNIAAYVATLPAASSSRGRKAASAHSTRPPTLGAP